jgi:predicted alpha-1,6-mannanase (GH76 family)
MAYPSVPPRSSSDSWSTIAATAARSVIRHFGGPVLNLPGTHMAAVKRPGSVNNFAAPFHYWWQAHYIDALVDAGWRELRTGERLNGPSLPSAGELAARTAKTVVRRNFFRVTNSYYDDMAWLALAINRLDSLATSAGKPGTGERSSMHRALTDRLLSAATDDLGGGVYWNTKRQFKNTAATAPTALYFALRSDADPSLTERAQGLVDWLEENVLDERGLYTDGVKIIDGKPVLDETVFTYNQGPVLGALLVLGGAKNLARVGTTVEAVKSHLTEPRTHILTLGGTGDGGLFTGILCRYLAQVAVDPRLPESVRTRAGALVTTTASTVWKGRGERWAHTGIIKKPERVLIFPKSAGASAEEDYPGQNVIELSTQLQAWMIFEAAASIEEYHRS